MKRIKTTLFESQSLKDQGKSRTIIRGMYNGFYQSQSLKDQGKSRTVAVWRASCTRRRRNPLKIRASLGLVAQTVFITAAVAIP